MAFLQSSINTIFCIDFSIQNADSKINLQLVQKMTYSLRQMVDITGLTEFTLRGWELRYGAFRPARTETARRQYSSTDLQKAILLRELLRRDSKISEIAGLSVKKLKELIESQSQAGTEPDSDSGSKRHSPQDSRRLSRSSRRDSHESLPANFKGAEFKTEIESVMGHLALQEWDDLEDCFRSANKRLSPLEVIKDFIVPIVHEMGRKTALGHLSISQEHILSALMKQTLHSLTKNQPTRSGPKIIIASPEGDFHELGILIAHAMASQLNVRSLYLGPNTPKQDLCETATRFEATHLLLSSTISRTEGAKDDFYSFVHFLDQNVARQMTFWFGGRSCGSINLKRKAVFFDSLIDLHRELMGLSARRRKPKGNSKRNPV